MPKITDVQAIRTRANGTWVIVKVLTDQPGLYGIGSASDHYRASTVITALETIKPLLIGREASHIEDIWQTIYTSGYWRNDSIINTVQAGIDMALWDIRGKEAGMPVYQLLGGSCRSAVPCYAHAAGDDLDAVEEDVRRYMEEGYDVIRCQLGPYGGGGFVEGEKAGQPKNGRNLSRVFDDEAYLANIPAMFAHLRDKIGFGPKLTHDVHEHLRPHNAVALAKSHISDRAIETARMAVELHGGIGFTWECDVQMWFKRAMFDRAFLGTPETLRERCARLAGW